MRKVKHVGIAMIQKNDRNGRTMEILKTRAVSQEQVCSECKTQARSIGSSRCQECSHAYRLKSKTLGRIPAKIEREKNLK